MAKEIKLSLEGVEAIAVATTNDIKEATENISERMDFKATEEVVNEVVSTIRKEEIKNFTRLDKIFYIARGAFIKGYTQAFTEYSSLVKRGIEETKNNVGGF